MFNHAAAAGRRGGPRRRYATLPLGGTPLQLFDQARDGIADVIWTAATFQSGRFTKTEVFELPFMINSAEKGSPAL